MLSGWSSPKEKCSTTYKERGQCNTTQEGQRGTTTFLSLVPFLLFPFLLSPIRFVHLYKKQEEGDARTTQEHAARHQGEMGQKTAPPQRAGEKTASPKGGGELQHYPQGVTHKEWGKQQVLSRPFPTVILALFPPSSVWSYFYLGVEYLPLGSDLNIELEVIVSNSNDNYVYIGLTDDDQILHKFTNSIWLCYFSKKKTMCWQKKCTLFFFLRAVRRHSFFFVDSFASFTSGRSLHSTG